MKKTILKLLIISILATAHQTFTCDLNEGKESKSIKPQNTVIAESETPPPLSETYLVIENLQGIENYIIKYDSTLYRGGEILDVNGIKTLKKLGIKTVLSIAPSEKERQLISDNGIKFIPFSFKMNALSVDSLEYMLNKVKNAFPVYIQCHKGMHRPGIVAAGYRIMFEKWTYEKAVLEFGRLGGSLKEDAEMLGVLKSISDRINK